MAIEFARVRYVTRSDGGNACRSAAYNARSDVFCERTRERFFFEHRDPTLHHEILLPEGADTKFLDKVVLWNAAQAMEKRKDSQEARELLLALPSDPEMDLEDWQEMCREFAHENFVSKGVAVQLDIHPPHDGDVNVHAHLLITTRRIEGDRLSAKKARDLDPEVRTMKGKQKIVTEGERWGVLWREYQNRYFERQGLELRVDETGFAPQRHEGPVRLRTTPLASDARLEQTRADNEAAARDPVQVLAKLTEHRATFTELDIERLLRKHIFHPAERREIAVAVLARPEVMALHDRATGTFMNRFTTREVRAEELEVIEAAQTIAKKRRAIDDRRALRAAEESRLDQQQRAAFVKATGTDGLVVIEGLAGAGKTHSLSAIRVAHERAGWRVIGLAPTNVVAESLRASGFKHGSTAHLELYWQDQKRFDRVPAWDRRTVVVLEEAAMMDTHIYARLMRLAAETGAKMILTGDDRQLASVERGGMFTELKQRHGSVIISKVRRQQQEWQRVASEDFANRRVAEGLRAYAEHGHVHWSTKLDESRSRLLSDWDQDSRERPKLNRFVYASTNAEVNRLNRAIHDIRLARKEIKNELEVDTVKGKLAIGKGERIQFHGNDKKQGIYNGSIGTVTAIEGQTIFVRTDTDRDIKFDARTFREYGLGYAGTVYRGQGKTQAEVYALYDHSYAWNARTAYVGLTRHTDRVELYVSRDLAVSEIALGEQMERVLHDEASLAWATRAELQLQKERDGREGQEGRGAPAAGATKSGAAVKDKAQSHAKDGRPPQVLRRLDLTAYAHEVHGYEVKRDPSGKPDHFILTRTNSRGATDRLEVRKAKDGHWTWRATQGLKTTGDIFDFAKRMGAPDLEAAREAVRDYDATMRDPEKRQRAAKAKAKPEIAPDDPERALKGAGAEVDQAREIAGAEHEDRLDAAADAEEQRLQFARAETERVERLNKEATQARDTEQQQIRRVANDHSPNRDAWLDAKSQEAVEAQKARSAKPAREAETPERETQRIESRTSATPAVGVPAPAQMRYTEALARDYDPRAPIASLAKASLTEAAAFQRDQHELNQRIAAEPDPGKREAIMLRRDIEHADHMSQAYGRVAGLGRAVGAKETPDYEKRVQEYKQQGQQARQLWAERGKEHPDLYPPLNPELDRQQERGKEAPTKQPERSLEQERGKEAPTKQPERSLEQEREAMKRLDLPEYAASKHGYEIDWRNEEHSRAGLTKGDEQISATRDKDGAWSYTSRTDFHDKGDILDFEARRGAKTFSRAREEVRPELERVEQERGRLDLQPQQERSGPERDGPSHDDHDGPGLDPTHRKKRRR